MIKTSEYVFTNGELRHADSELYHYGVLGMKWGVRRYQNADGSLTDKGRERFNSVAGSTYKTKRDTRRAVRVLRKNQKVYARLRKGAEKALTKQEKKAEKYEKGSEAYEKAVRLGKEAREDGKRYLELNNKTTKFLTDISDGTKKAGRDFIVQVDRNIHISNFGIGRDLGNTLLENAAGNYTKRTTINPFYGSKDSQIIERRPRR